MSHPTTSLCDAAFAYARTLGPVFPLPSRSKVPWHNSRGFLDATLDSAQIKAWWETNPAQNIGLATGNLLRGDDQRRLLVLDIDGGHVGAASLAALEREQETMPTTLAARTGGGGLHLFLGYPADVALRNSAGKLGENLDARASGGYVLLAPSVHPSGKSYRWLNDDPVAEAPEWLLEAMAAPLRPSNTTAGEMGLIPHGRRDDTLYKVGCSMRRFGFAVEAIEGALGVLAEHCEQPADDPVTARDVARIAKSAAAKPPARHGLWSQRRLRAGK